jgi:hypothetical protein
LIEDHGGDTNTQELAGYVTRPEIPLMTTAQIVGREILPAAAF